MTVVSNNDNSTKVTASCGAGRHAIGGGGSSNSHDLIDSYPSNGGTAATSGTNPTSWTAEFSAATGSNTAYAICVPN